MAYNPRSQFSTCPNCGNESLNAVVDSRPFVMGNKRVVRRVRTCDSCEERISTIEVPETFLRELAEYGRIIDLIRSLPSFSTGVAPHKAVSGLHSAASKTGRPVNKSRGRIK
jgi:hypothetical protein